MLPCAFMYGSVVSAMSIACPPPGHRSRGRQTCLQVGGRCSLADVPDGIAPGLDFGGRRGDTCGSGGRVLALSEGSKTLMVDRESAPGRNRTYGLALRRRTLYPLSYRREV